MKILKFLILIMLITCGTMSISFAQKQMETLNRGVLAVRTSTNEVLVSWRIYGTEFTNASYNIYRGTTLLNTTPISGASNFIDTTTTNGNYSVAAVIDNVEQELSEPVEVWNTFYKSIPITAPLGGTTPSGETYTYTANDASVGDLDGDGDYEIVLKWMPTNSKDNAHDGYTGNTILQGLEMDGTVLWTIDLGINIRSGAHYTQFMVYDLDGDGKAEIACKTADGTMDATGTILGNANADYRNPQGRILSGPEFFSLFSGETGAFITSQNYIPARGTVSSWGDNYGNRVDRFLACVAYLDGQRPSLIFARGYYTRVVLAAYDYRDNQLTNRWIFDTNNAGNSSCFAQGNHNITVGDVDDDGNDEIQYGSCAIDDDGTVLYSTGFGHGDASHLGDFDPNRSGLEYFMVHEVANGSTIPAMDFRDPLTGSVIWDISGSGDIGRGLTADINPDYLGAESWSSLGSGVYSATGEFITATYPTTAGNGRTYNMAAWFDGDLLRELVDRTVITKWNSVTNSTDRVLTTYNFGDSVSNNGTKSNPCLIADILGDWREEIIYRNSTNTALNIFTTPNETNHKIFTLMHDPLYRTSIAWQNVGYNQPAHTSFYLGDGMPVPNTPDIYLTQSTTLSVNELDKNNNLEFKIYPNPNTSGVLGINATSLLNPDVEITIYNIYGSIILKKKYTNTTLNNFTKNIDISNLNSGIYMIELKSGTQSDVKKLIKN